MKEHICKRWEDLSRDEKVKLLRCGEAAGLVGAHWDELLDEYSLHVYRKSLLEVGLEHQPLSDLLREKWEEVPPPLRLTARRCQQLEWLHALPPMVRKTVRRKGVKTEIAGEVLEERPDGFLVSFEWEGLPLCAFWKKGDCEPF